MSGLHAVIGKLHHILRATPVTLFHVVGIQAKRPIAVYRAIQDFRPGTAKHGLQITTVDLPIETIAKILEVVGL